MSKVYFVFVFLVVSLRPHYFIYFMHYFVYYFLCELYFPPLQLSFLPHPFYLFFPLPLFSSTLLITSSFCPSGNTFLVGTFIFHSPLHIFLFLPHLLPSRPLSSSFKPVFCIILSNPFRSFQSYLLHSSIPFSSLPFSLLFSLLLPRHLLDSKLLRGTRFLREELTRTRL